MKSKYSVQEKLEWMRLLEYGRTVYYISKISGWCKNDIGILREKYKKIHKFGDIATFS